MNAPIAVKRETLELGTLPAEEALELLEHGFLLPTDYWRADTVGEWLPMSRLKKLESERPAGASVSNMVWQKLSATGSSVARTASQATEKLKSLAGRSQNKLNAAATLMLDASTPQLKKLVSHELLKQPVRSVQKTVHNDDFMQKLFGATYDCLPKPVCRFVGEAAFIQFCMERRRLLVPELAETPAASASPSVVAEPSAKTVAIIGASNDRAKFGNKAVRAFLQQGYEVFPVNPKEEIIEGLPAYKTIADVPVRPYKISVYLPPNLLLKLLPEIAARGCDEFWLNPGTESAEVVAEAEQLGLNVIQACSIVGIGVSPDGM